MKKKKVNSNFSIFVISVPNHPPSPLVATMGWIIILLLHTRLVKYIVCPKLYFVSKVKKYFVRPIEGREIKWLKKIRCVCVCFFFKGCHLLIQSELCFCWLNLYHYGWLRAYFKKVGKFIWVKFLNLRFTPLILLGDIKEVAIVRHVVQKWG